MSEDYQLQDAPRPKKYRKELRESVFQAGDSLYRSVYNKPMQSSMWLCCFKIERAPLV